MSIWCRFTLSLNILFFIVAYLSILSKQGSVSEWKVVFWIISGLLFVGVVIFVFFGSGQQQSWNKELATSSFVADENTAALLAGNDAKDS